MLPEYSSFISRHSLPTICAQNYIIAALIEVIKKVYTYIYIDI